jgi:hypothetical protein
MPAGTYGAVLLLECAGSGTPESNGLEFRLPSMDGFGGCRASKMEIPLTRSFKCDLGPTDVRDGIFRVELRMKPQAGSNCGILHIRFLPAGVAPMGKTPDTDASTKMKDEMKKAGYW